MDVCTVSVRQHRRSEAAGRIGQKSTTGGCHCVSLSSAQQVESGVWRLGVHQGSLLQEATEFFGRVVIAHGCNATPWPLFVGDFVDRGAGRYEQGVVDLENGRREVAYAGSPSIARHK